MEKIKAILSDRRVWTTVASIAIMAVIAFVYFYPDDVYGNVLQQHDMKQGAANGHEAQVHLEKTGETTRWTNSLLGGMPTFQISPSYPSNSLFDWINPVMGLGLPQPANLLFMMMVGFFILLLALKLRWWIALAGAIAYGFSSYFIIIIGAGHIWKFITLAYVPPTIAGIVLCYRGRYLTGGALAALFAMMQIASNHVQMTYYFLFVVVGLMIAYAVMSYREKKMRRWITATCVLCGAATLAVVANLPSLYNTYEYSKQTIRGGHSELTQPESDSQMETSGGLNRDYIYAYSYGQAETFSLLIPNVKGGATIKPEKGSYKRLTLDQLPEASDYATDAEAMWVLPQVYQYFGEPEGTNGPVYVGALIVALFVLGCVIVRGPMKWALLVLTVFSIFLAMGRNCVWLTDLMIDYMPMYNKFRAPESILVIAEFTMPLLAALALGQLFGPKPQEAFERYGKATLWSFGAVMLICLAGAIVPSVFGQAISADEARALSQYSSAYSAVESLRLGMISADALRSLLIVAMGLIVLYLWFKRTLKLPVAGAIVGILVLGDLYLVNKRYLDHDSFTPDMTSVEQAFEPSAADRQILADTAMNYRVFDTRIGSADPSYFHKTIGGYHAAKLSRYNDMLDYYFYGKYGAHDNLNMLAMLNARYATDGNAVEPIPEAMGNAWLVDRVTYTDTPDAEIAAVETLDLGSEAVADKKFQSVLGNSQPKQPGDTIFETTYAPNRLTYHVNTASGGVAVFSEVYFPWGWHATIDGKPAELGRVNYILRALRIPAGSHTIEMRFDPKSVHTTTTAAYISIALIYLLLIAAVVVAVMRFNSKPKLTEKQDGTTGQTTSTSNEV